MNKRNVTIMKHMVRLSHHIALVMFARSSYQESKEGLTWFVTRGRTLDALTMDIAKIIDSSREIELYLRQSVKLCCEYLEGFDSNLMGSIDFISSSDLESGYTALCKEDGSGSYILSLSTGEIIPEKMIDNYSKQLDLFAEES